MVFPHAESGQCRTRQALRRYRLRGGQRQHHGADRSHTAHNRPCCKERRRSHRNTGRHIPQRSTLLQTRHKPRGGRGRKAERQRPHTRLPRKGDTDRGTDLQILHGSRKRRQPRRLHHRRQRDNRRQRTPLLERVLDTSQMEPTVYKQGCAATETGVHIKLQKRHTRGRAPRQQSLLDHTPLPLTPRAVSRLPHLRTNQRAESTKQRRHRHRRMSRRAHRRMLHERQRRCRSAERRKGNMGGQGQDERSKPQHHHTELPLRSGARMPDAGKRKRIRQEHHSAKHKGGQVRPRAMAEDETRHTAALRIHHRGEHHRHDGQRTRNKTMDAVLQKRRTEGHAAQPM